MDFEEFKKDIDEFLTSMTAEELERELEKYGCIWEIPKDEACPSCGRISTGQQDEGWRLACDWNRVMDIVDDEYLRSLLES